jgi:hypothetical protein
MRLAIFFLVCPVLVFLWGLLGLVLCVVPARVRDRILVRGSFGFNFFPVKGVKVLVRSCYDVMLCCVVCCVVLLCWAGLCWVGLCGVELFSFVFCVILWCVLLSYVVLCPVLCLVFVSGFCLRLDLIYWCVFCFLCACLLRKFEPLDLTGRSALRCNTTGVLPSWRQNSSRSINL